MVPDPCGRCNFLCFSKLLHQNLSADIENVTKYYMEREMTLQKRRGRQAHLVLFGDTAYLTFEFGVLLIHSLDQVLLGTVSRRGLR